MDGDATVIEIGPESSPTVGRRPPPPYRLVLIVGVLVAALVGAYLAGRIAGARERAPMPATLTPTPEILTPGPDSRPFQLAAQLLHGASTWRAVQGFNSADDTIGLLVHVGGARSPGLQSGRYRLWLTCYAGGGSVDVVFDFGSSGGVVVLNMACNGYGAPTEDPADDRRVATTGVRLTTEPSTATAYVIASGTGAVGWQLVPE